MNILIVGCGKVGARLASVLSREGHDISIVDKEESAFDLLDGDYSGFTTTGVPIDQDVLRKAGIESCEAIATVSSDDNVNVMVSQVAREIFHVGTIIARIYDPEREDVFSHFGLHTVCPTNLTVSAIRSALFGRRQTKTINFGSHTASFTSIALPKTLVGTKVSQYPCESYETVFAVEHEDLSLDLAFPNLVLQDGDTLILAEIAD